MAHLLVWLVALTYASSPIRQNAVMDVVVGDVIGTSHAVSGFTPVLSDLHVINIWILRDRPNA
jgi:hypothetical protein